MNEPKKPLDKIAAKGDGMTVPDGYFEDFATKMAGSLPFREVLDIPEKEQRAPRNKMWLRVRPYVYMAAMFAGAWCLLKTFTLMSPSHNDINISNYPQLSEALEDKNFVEEYIVDDLSTFDLAESYYDEGYIDLPDEASLTEDSTAVSADDSEHSYILPTDSYKDQTK